MPWVKGQGPQCCNCLRWSRTCNKFSLTKQLRLTEGSFYNKCPSYECGCDYHITPPGLDGTRHGGVRCPSDKCEGGNAGLEPNERRVALVDHWHPITEDKWMEFWEDNCG